ncbi:MAG: glutathione synthase [Pseudomonadota bacterium]
MSISLGVVMDAITGIKTYKDSTFAMLLAAQRRGWQIWYMEQEDLWADAGGSHARMRALKVRDDPGDWFEFGSDREARLEDLDVILMRKDPPFDMEYIASTYVLQSAAERGTLVVNDPASLRENNEKMAILRFPECCPPTLVSRRAQQFLAFLEEHGDMVLKPLDSMGGASIFRVQAGDTNTNVILETLTQNERRTLMAQRFVPEIRDGDKRILMLDGKPVPYALARLPKAGDFRGNLAAGGSARGLPLGERDRWIASKVGPYLQEQGILFAGLDVIGDYLTEINVTSPTCIRELDAEFGLDIAGDLMELIASKLPT